jgi:hypothetical protein
MTDLNNWRLAYPGIAFDFGVKATEYPFRVQAIIGPPTRKVQDAEHPTSDGMVMGIDSLGGFDITFGLTTLPDSTDTPWRHSLDLVRNFQGKWRADAIRRTPGAYASLTNLDRNVRVYGRPREFVPTLDRVRKGLAEYLATFSTIDPNFYDETENVSIINAVNPSGGGFVAPLSPPFSTAAGGAVLDPISNEGNIATWPVIRFHGPCTEAGVELLSGATVLWNLRVSGQIKYDEIVTVDTRPWARSATINGKPANGRLRGTQLEKCVIPVGAYHTRYKVKDRTGTSFVDIKWRDAYASL